MKKRENFFPVGTGEPASKKELDKLRGRTDATGFVPADPEKAEKYYLKKRSQMLNKHHFSHGESLELFRYYNKKLLDLYFEHPEIKKENEYDQERILLGEKFEEFFKDKIITILKKEHYSLTPGLTITTSADFEKEFLGYSFDFTLTAISSDQDKEIYEYDFDLKDKNSNENFIGKISVDLKNQDVKINLLPDVNPELNTSDVNKEISSSEKTKALMGMSYLLQKPEMIYTPFKGDHKNSISEDDNLEGEIESEKKPISVGAEIKKATMSFKRRLVDDVNLAWEKAQDLLSSYDEKTLRNLEKEFGVLSFNVFFVVFDKNDKGRHSDYFSKTIANAGKVGSCSVNRAEVEALVQQALNRGGEAVISLNGSQIPLELEDKPAGSAKTVHLRRQNGKIVLVMGKKFKGEIYRRIKEVYNKKMNGIEVSEEDEKMLMDFLRKYNIDDLAQTSFVFADSAKDINTKSKKEGGRANYIIKPSKMRKK